MGLEPTTPCVQSTLRVFRTFPPLYLTSQSPCHTRVPVRGRSWRFTTVRGISELYPSRYPSRLRGGDLQGGAQTITGRAGSASDGTTAWTRPPSDGRTGGSCRRRRQPSRG